MFPVARGANGHPPIPPTEASSTVAPASSATRAVAYPVLRVLWRGAVWVNDRVGDAMEVLLVRTGRGLKVLGCGLARATIALVAALPKRKPTAPAPAPVAKAKRPTGPAPVSVSVDTPPSVHPHRASHDGSQAPIPLESATEVEPEPVALTGVDYIALLAQADRAETAGRLHLSHLADPPQPTPADASGGDDIDAADDGVGGRPR